MTRKERKLQSKIKRLRFSNLLGHPSAEHSSVNLPLEMKSVLPLCTTVTPPSALETSATSCGSKHKMPSSSNFLGFKFPSDLLQYTGFSVSELFGYRDPSPLKWFAIWTNSIRTRLDTETPTPVRIQRHLGVRTFKALIQIWIPRPRKWFVIRTSLDTETPTPVRIPRPQCTF